MNNGLKNIGPTYHATPYKLKLTLSREIEDHVKQLIKERFGNGSKVNSGLGRLNGFFFTKKGRY